MDIDLGIKLIIVNCFAWVLDIEGGKGIGGESIYGPLFEGRLFKVIR